MFCTTYSFKKNSKWHIYIYIYVRHSKRWVNIFRILSTHLGHTTEVTGFCTLGAIKIRASGTVKPLIPYFCINIDIDI